MFLRILKSVYSLGLVLAMASPVVSEPMENFWASRYDYFAQIPALPIRFPQGEVAGDVYDEPGVFLYRKRDCFPDVNADSSDSNFPSFRMKANQAAAARLGVDFRRGSMSVEGDAAGRVKFKNTVAISFANPVETHSIPNGTFADLFRDRDSANECLESLVQRLNADVGDSYYRGVPWIIAQVWSASETTSIKTATVIEGEVEVGLEERLSQLQGEVGIEYEKTADAYIVRHTNQVYPVAWRPAFISKSHLEYVTELGQPEGWFRWVLRQTPLYQSKNDIMEILRNEFKVDPKEVVPEAKTVLSDMRYGPAIPYESENEQHEKYLHDVGVLVALGYEVHGQ